MRAVRIHEYGGPEVLRLDEVEKPTPRPRDVLVRVRATAVNPVDWKLRSGGQRNLVRYRLPWILGLDVSGVVEAVGAEVTRFKVGDEVWSSPAHNRPGTYAEYVCIDERQVGRKPGNVTHEEAASIPLVGLTASQCLVDSGRLQRGERVLIHAGAGGVGTFAIQLAKHLGAHVITTASERNEALVRSLGADEVIDYRKVSFADACAPVDLILDSLGEDGFEDNLRVLREGGRIANISVDVPRHVERHGPFLSLFTVAYAMARLIVAPYFRKRIRSRHVIKRSDGMQLDTIAGLVEQGAIRPVIDRVLPLTEIQEAHRHSASHRASGKIVLRVSEG
ncbi:zinc-containing alcohol dehydrogenase [Minicystis rosea]|nr:zinc-containing alcohol dehydrogenase [Minicystis rosea]